MTAALPYATSLGILAVLVIALVVMRRKRTFMAVCPRCRGEGCEQCDAGRVHIQMASGDLYTLKCQVCGFENGGRIVNEDLPLTDPEIGCLECCAPPEQQKYVKVGRVR